ncbi:MAG: PKD domain-containing protein [Verrucomicrobiales bacterium]|nr:PKD domain-containing protein [Verrucomicrobiales bacterium]
MNFRRALCWLTFSLAFLGGLWFWLATPRPTAPQPPYHPRLSERTVASPATTPQTATQTKKEPEQSSDRLSAIAAWARSIPEGKFARFAEWAERYTRATGVEKSSLEAEGVELAHKRRDEMSDMIQSHPDHALQLAVPFHVRQELPASVASFLEEPISARGDLAVLAALLAPGHEGEIAPVYRTATIGDQTYEAFVYGRRLGEPTREGIPLHGVALDRLLAVHENPVRILDSREASFRKQQLAPNADPVCQISGLSSAGKGEETVADVGGVLAFLCGPEHAEQLNEELIAAEAGTGNAEGDGGFLAASDYTEGLKSVIVIRVDFSDLEGEPFSETAGQNMVSGVNNFYRQMSYGKTGFALVGEGSDVTPTFRMDNTAAYYGARDPSVLRKAARAAATEAGYDLTQYSFDLICVGPVLGFKFTGLGYVGAPGAWIRDSSAMGVAAHELGHNFGLNHANFWDTASQSVIGSGTTVEYGDKFDTMGSSTAGSKHFNARYKNYLNWLTGTDVRTVTENGTFRIYAHDDPDSTGLRALKIAKNTATNYWVEFRAHYPGNKWLGFGAGLRWGHPANQSTRLLDTTPGTPAGKDDSCILVGRTFSDFAAAIHITPVGRSGTPPHWLDVTVNKGSFPENVAPTVSLTASVTEAAPNTPLGFTAHAADPNGDALAYFWDFGDGNFGQNVPEATHSWSTTGEYLVQCTVTDMKGGIASSSVIARIGSPNTYRISGRVLANGQPVQGVRISASSTQITYTDSDGRYNLVKLAAGSYSLKTTLEGYVFSHPDFVNPIRVGPSRDNIDFVAVPPDGQNTVSLVAAGSVWQYLDDGSNQGTAWRDLDFDDSKWSEGPAPLGYGDDNEKTVVRFGPSSNNKYPTTYFRRRFTVADSRLVSGLTLGLRRDDGAVVYLNGRELLRSNMPEGTISSTTLASTTAGSTDETTFFQSDVDPAFLRTGTNVFAVEIHQASRSSSDIAFDLELLGTAAALVAPPNLSWKLSGQVLKLTWPKSTTAWKLYAASELGQNSVWTAVNAPVSESNDQRQVTIIPSRSQFYRLRSP